MAEIKAPDGSPSTVEMKCEWASHKKFIKYIGTRKTGQQSLPAFEGVCGFHPVKKQLVLWETDNAGNLTEAVITADRNTLNYEELIYEMDGTTQPVRAQVIREGEDEFVFKASVPKEGKWLEVFSAKYRRGAK